jgi:hypothetical protein
VTAKRVAADRAALVPNGGAWAAHILEAGDEMRKNRNQSADASAMALLNRARQFYKMAENSFVERAALRHALFQSYFFPRSVVTQDLGQEILDRPASPRHDQVWVAQPVLSKYLYGVCGQLVSKGRKSGIFPPTIKERPLPKTANEWAVFPALYFFLSRWPDWRDSFAVVGKRDNSAAKPTKAQEI